VAASADGLAASMNLEGSTYLWDPRERKSLGQLPSQFNSNNLALSPDGKWVAGGDAKGAAQLWDLRFTQAPHSELLGHGASQLTKLAFSHDSRRLLSGSRDKTARLWNLVQPDTSLKFGPHPSSVEAVAFSPADPWSISVCDDGSVHLWDMQQRDPRATVADARPGGYRRRPDGQPSSETGFNSCVAVSPDGTRVAAAFEGHSLDVWELAQAATDPFPTRTNELQGGAKG
jgi:WD40 repeat protein